MGLVYCSDYIEHPAVVPSDACRPHAEYTDLYCTHVLTVHGGTFV